MSTLTIQHAGTRPTMSRVGHEILVTIAASSCIALLAQLSIPIGPIPVTGQTLGVLAVAWALGRVRAVNAVALYLAKGASGLPVFAGGSAGAAVLLGPTGGYLLGFLLAALVVGLISDWARAHKSEMSGLTAWCAFAAGTISVYIPGMLLLSRFVRGQVVQLGLLPFLPGDTLKLFILVALLPVLNRRPNRR